MRNAVTRLLPSILLFLAVTFGASGETTGAQEAPVASGTWAQAKAGDWVEYAMADGPGLRLEVVEVKEGQVTYRHIIPRAGGEPLVRVHTRKPEEIRPVFSAAPGAAITRREASIEIAGQSLNCEVLSWTAGGGNETSKGEVWTSAQVPCGGLVKQVTDGKDTMWLTGFGRDSAKPEKPEPELRPDHPPKLVTREYGDAIALDVPARIKKEMEDQAVAITRLRVYFSEGSTQDGASLEFEDMHTEVPVIFAAFLGERCDKVLAYGDYSARPGRYVDLAFQIKTLPAKLAGMKVKVEHSHVQGDTETVLTAFDVPVPDAGDPWNDMRLRGARPGVNRYRLVVSYTNAQKETTTYRGFSHWVIVQAPPMFEFTHTATATATARKAGGTTLLQADVRWDASFVLHHGLKAQDCSLRVVKRGKRDLRLDGLSPEVRRVIEKERPSAGWHEVGRGPLINPGIPGLERTVVEESFVTLSFRHVLSLTAKALPLDDAWEYRFELMHSGMSEPLAVWEASAKLKIAAENEIDRARLGVNGSRLPAPLDVPLSRR